MSSIIMLVSFFIAIGPVFTSVFMLVVESNQWLRIIASADTETQANLPLKCPHGADLRQTVINCMGS